MQKLENGVLIKSFIIQSELIMDWRCGNNQIIISSYYLYFLHKSMQGIFKKYILSNVDTFFKRIFKNS